MNKNDTSWGGVAEWYNDLLEDSDDSFQSKVILPNLLRILEVKSGMNLLDVACGQGYFSRTFARNGAKVVGCDISRELIKLATDRAASPKDTSMKDVKGLEFKIASADKLDFAKDGSYDVVTIVLAIQNIENLAGTIAECSRVLRSGGRLVVVLNHPSFRIPKRSAWDWDMKAGKQYRRIDAYLSDSRVEIDMNPGATPQTRKKITVSFHRPLQSYFKFLNKSGFSVARLEEWISHRKSEKGPRADEEDRTRKEIPMFLMLEAVKK